MLNPWQRWSSLAHCSVKLCTSSSPLLLPLLVALHCRIKKSLLDGLDGLDETKLAWDFSNGVTSQYRNKWCGCIVSNFSADLFARLYLSFYVTPHHTRLTALFPGLPRWAGTRKVKPIWVLVKQETVSGSGISWDICKSAPCSRQTTTQVPHWGQPRRRVGPAPGSGHAWARPGSAIKTRAQRQLEWTEESDR